MKFFRLLSPFAALALFTMASAPAASAQDSGRVIPIVAKKFGYFPNEVRLKKGETVTLLLKTEDVPHGLKSKDLQLDAKILPGQETKVTVTPQTAGQFIGFCSTFCGSGHFDMRMTFIVE